MPRSVPAGHAAITPGRTTLIKKLCLSPVLCAWTLVGFAWAATAGTTHQRSPVLMLPEKAHLSSVIAHTDVAGKEKKTWLNAWLLTTYKPASFGPAAGRKPRTARRPWRVGRSSKLPSFQASWERFVAVKICRENSRRHFPHICSDMSESVPRVLFLTNFPCSIADSVFSHCFISPPADPTRLQG